MGTETIKVVEKEYDLKNFITGKKIIKINKTIKNINSKNAEEQFMGVDVDKQIIHKIKYLLLAKKSNDMINIKNINQNNFNFSLIKINIEKTDNDSSIINLNGIIIKGEFNVIKTYLIITNNKCNIEEKRYEDRKSDLNTEEFDRMTKILTEEINAEFNKLSLDTPNEN